MAGKQNSSLEKLSDCISINAKVINDEINEIKSKLKLSFDLLTGNDVNNKIF